MRTAGPAAVRSWYALFPLSEHPYAASEKTKSAKKDRFTFHLLSRYRSESSSGIRHYFSNAAPTGFPNQVGVESDGAPHLKELEPPPGSPSRWT